MPSEEVKEAFERVLRHSLWPGKRYNSKKAVSNRPYSRRLDISHYRKNHFALVNLAMHLALVVIPDFPAGLPENGLDRQEKAHLLRLENAALRIDAGDATAVGAEAGRAARRISSAPVTTLHSLTRVDAIAFAPADRLAQDPSHRE